MKKMISMKVKPNLLMAIDLFCEKNEMTRTEYFERLAEHHLKKRGLLVEKEIVTETWEDVWDMPLNPETKTEKWVQVA